MEKMENQSVIDEAIAYGKKAYQTLVANSHHRDRSWEHCHKACLYCRETCRQESREPNDKEVDELCLHLAVYLASWGMYRNSFLMGNDYKIHADVVRILLDSNRDDLWEISADKMAEETKAESIMDLYGAIRDTYREIAGTTPTDTLLTKVLLATVCCTPAFDTNFKKAMSLTGITKQKCCKESLMALGKFYKKHMESQFEDFFEDKDIDEKYPAARMIDMCFFEYGQALYNAEKEGKTAKS